MPYSIRKVGRAYQVVNSDTGKVHAKHTTKAKAESQVRLLNAQDHGFKPDATKRLSNGTVVRVKFVGKRGK